MCESTGEPSVCSRSKAAGAPEGRAASNASMYGSVAAVGFATAALWCVCPPAAFVCLAAALVMLLGQRCAPKSPPTSWAVDEQLAPSRGYEDPLRFSFLPSTGVLRSGASTPARAENEFCTINLIAMHQPTHKPWLEQTGDYPYSWHLAGRRRLWEIRLNIRFKKLPKGSFYFGLELNAEGTGASGSTTAVGKLMTHTAKKMLGEFYQSMGDDPAKTQGECEPPTFVMPPWAFDQFHVSEPGEEPDLAGDLEGVGMQRSGNVVNYIKAFRKTLEELSCDKVYTFCFWGVSQYLDIIHWQTRSGLRYDLNTLVGQPPLYVVLYDMPRPAEDGDTRHLVSKKNYYARIALWSAAKPPPPRVLQDVVGADVLEEDRRRDHVRAEAEPSLGLFDLVSAVGCCTARA